MKNRPKGRKSRILSVQHAFFKFEYPLNKDEVNLKRCLNHNTKFYSGSKVFKQRLPKLDLWNLTFISEI